MKVFMILSLMVAGQFAMASGSMHDGAQGECQIQAQSALTHLSRINHSGPRPTAVLQGAPGQVEVYTEGGANPQYRITTNSGMGENTCVVEEIEFNPEP